MKPYGALKMCDTEKILKKIDYEIYDSETDPTCTLDFLEGYIRGLKIAKRFINESK